MTPSPSVYVLANECVSAGTYCQVPITFALAVHTLAGSQLPRLHDFDKSWRKKCEVNFTSRDFRHPRRYALRDPSKSGLSDGVAPSVTLMAFAERENEMLVKN